MYFLFDDEILDLKLYFEGIITLCHSSALILKKQQKTRPFPSGFYFENLLLSFSYSFYFEKTHEKPKKTFILKCVITYCCAFLLAFILKAVTKRTLF